MYLKALSAIPSMNTPIVRPKTEMVVENVKRMRMIINRSEGAAREGKAVATTRDPTNREVETTEKRMKC